MWNVNNVSIKVFIQIFNTKFYETFHLSLTVQKLHKNDDFASNAWGKTTKFLFPSNPFIQCGFIKIDQSLLLGACLRTKYIKKMER
jgi:hypothetical protein